MRDAAYPPSSNATEHASSRVIADVITEKFGGLAESQPELLALPLHQRAASMATRCATGKAQRAAGGRTPGARRGDQSRGEAHMAVLARVPHPTRRRDRAELRLQLLLCHKAHRPPRDTAPIGSSGSTRPCDRAPQALGDETAGVKVLLGLEGYHFMRADFAKAHAIAVDAGAKAQRSGDAVHRVQSQWAVANTLSHQGEMETAGAAYGRLVVPSTIGSSIGRLPCRIGRHVPLATQRGRCG
jgi:hypothetical protein